MGFDRKQTAALVRNTGHVGLAAALSQPSNSVPRDRASCGYTHFEGDGRRVVGVSVRIPGLKLVNAMNRREHWRTRHNREKREKQAAGMTLLTVTPIGPPCKVTLTRLYAGRCQSMDVDGLAAAFKATQDAVARWMGTDDSARSGITWVYEQSRAGETAVVISIEPASAGEGTKR